MDWALLEKAAEDILYFLAVINPASKIAYLAAQEPPLNRRELFRVSCRASAAALIIFIVMALSGHFVLEYVFRVDLGTLRVAGGLVMFVIGLQMIREGVAAHPAHLSEISGRHEDFAIVPLAAPLIAGPGTITVMISYAALRGSRAVCLYICIAVFINMLIMMSANWLGRLFTRFGVMGALVKLTGLIVAAVAH